MNVNFKYKQKWDKQRWSIFPKVVKYMGLKVRIGGELKAGYTMHWNRKADIIC